MPWQSATQQIEHGISICVCSVLLTRRQSGRFAQHMAIESLGSLGNQVGRRRERIRQNAYRCVDIAARSRQNQLRPSFPFWPVVTRRMQPITSDIAISSQAERIRSVIWTATWRLGVGANLEDIPAPNRGPRHSSRLPSRRPRPMMRSPYLFSALM